MLAHAAHDDDEWSFRHTAMLRGNSIQYALPSLLGLDSESTKDPVCSDLKHRTAPQWMPALQCFCTVRDPKLALHPHQIQVRVRPTKTSILVHFRRLRYCTIHTILPIVTLRLFNLQAWIYYPYVATQRSSFTVTIESTAGALQRFKSTPSRSWGHFTSI